MVYLTHYTEYPIYEPAEGGYYYAGNEAFESFTFLTKWGAKRHLAKMRAELEAEEFRSEEHTSELQSPIVISYAVFCL